MRQKIIVMIAVMSGLFLAALDQSIVGTALPRIVRDFNGLNELSWVVTAYLLASTTMIPIAGKLSDIIGRRKVIIFGITVFAIGSLLAGASWNMLSLIAFRGLQGLGGGILMASAFSVIGDLFVPAERAKWQGLFGAVFGLSSVIGPLLGGFLTDHASWRWCFYLNVPIAIVAFGLIWRFLPTITFKGVERRIDYGGAVLLVVGLSALLLGFTWAGSEYAWGSWQIVSLFALALAFLGTFVRWESRHSDALMPLSIFKNGIFRVSVVMMFLVGIAMFGAIIYLPLFAQIVQGSSATNSGVILLPLVLSMTVASVLSGQITAKTGRYKTMAVASTFITTGSLFWLSTLGAGSSHADTIIRMIPLGLGLGIMMPLFNLVVQNAFPQKMLGVVSSSTQLFRGIGSTVGVAVMGTLLNHGIAARAAELKQTEFAKSMAAAGKSAGNIDANFLQQILSHEGQARVISQIGQLPSTMQHQARQSFDSFGLLARQVMADSITRVFLMAACVLVVSCVVVFFLKEIPLRKTVDHPQDTGL